MRISVKVYPRASKNNIIADAKGPLKVYTTKPAVGGEANKALIDALADHYGKRRSAIRIVTGTKNRNKVIEIK
jgi:hypothetical protein